MADTIPDLSGPVLISTMASICRRCLVLHLDHPSQEAACSPFPLLYALCMCPSNARDVGRPNQPINSMPFQMLANRCFYHQLVLYVHNGQPLLIQS